jgi:hypothetical protein
MKKIVPDEFLLPSGNPDVSAIGFPCLHVERQLAQACPSQTHLLLAPFVRPFRAAYLWSVCLSVCLLSSLSLSLFRELGLDEEGRSRLLRCR